MLLSVLMFVGLVLVAAALARARAAPLWVTAAVATGAVLSLVVDISGGSLVLAELSPLALLVGLGAAAWLWRPEQPLGFHGQDPDGAGRDLTGPGR